MGFVVSLIEAVVDVVTAVIKAIVDIVIQVVEVVIFTIMILLGFEFGEDQIIEYFEVRNVPLFDEDDHGFPIANIVKRAVLREDDITGELIYGSVFRSIKKDVARFISYIEQGKYYEPFPEVESHVTYVDYEETTVVLDSIEGEPCTIEYAKVGSLFPTEWAQYWFQTNTLYDVGTNELLRDPALFSNTTPPNSESVNVSIVGNDITLDIVSELLVSDEGSAGIVWEIDLTSMTYREPTDDFVIDIYNESNQVIDSGYVIPAKPLNMHYVVHYSKDSNPDRVYSFIYKVGEGTYPTLDDPNHPIETEFDGESLRAIPAIPLRLSNTNYTDFDPEKTDKINELLDIIKMDGEQILNGIMDDPDTKPGDVDNVYINFGIKMWDSSQAGMKYLYNMFQNLYSAQGVTQGIYDSTNSGDDKPYNKIKIAATDYEYAFQFAYIDYKYTSLGEINSNTLSEENAIYYSDLSKFDRNGKLSIPYYHSSGKGAYNVGYKADTLDEVQDFLDGNGVVNPGDTTSEASNWLQVTKRMVYTETLQEANGSVSDYRYLNPDQVYRNSGGVLRMIQRASEETTAGQSITYYFITDIGLHAYTVKAPLGALKVVDGDTSKFKMVRFNLAAKDDLMVPIMYDFIESISMNDMATLFMAGAHVSIYIAHYEVIEAAGFSWLKALIMIIIIVVIVVVSWGSGTGPAMALFQAVAAGASASVITTAAINLFVSMVINTLVQEVVKRAIVAVVGDGPMGQLLASVVGSVIGGAISGGYSAEGGFSISFDFSTEGFSWIDVAKLFQAGAGYYNQTKLESIENDYLAFQEEASKQLKDLHDDLASLSKLEKNLFRSADSYTLSGLLNEKYSSSSQIISAEASLIMQDNYVETNFMDYDYGNKIDLAVGHSEFI